MAGLKKDNLSDSLLEYLEGLGLSEEQVQQLIDNISGDLSDLQTTDKSSLVAASSWTGEQYLTLSLSTGDYPFLLYDMILY